MKEKVRVLLVDDDAAVRGLARVILEHERWHVVEAGSLQEAIGKVREHGFRLDVAVVDLLLPDGLGTDLAEDLRRVHHKSKIVYITGDPGWLRRLNGGCDFVLAKPFSPVQLVAAVRAAIETIKQVVVFVEPERVYRRLINSALERENVAIAMASSFEEGLLLAREREAAVLFTPSPVGDDALAALLDLRMCLPFIGVVALNADPSGNHSKWYDQRLVRSYSVQEVAHAVRQALNRRENTPAPPSKGSEVHQDGDG